jgi:hypothetical protein
MQDDSIERDKPCVMPMCTPMQMHAANMPGTFAENGTVRKVFARSRNRQPVTRRRFLRPTPLPFAARPVVNDVREVANMVADVSIGSIALGTMHCMPHQRYGQREAGHFSSFLLSSLNA